MPKSWTNPARFVCVHKVVRERQPEPLQLDPFVPRQAGYEFRVIATNKTVSPATILAFHNGLGTQEGPFAQIKTQCQLDYVPCRRLNLDDSGSPTDPWVCHVLSVDWTERLCFTRFLRADKSG